MHILFSIQPNESKFFEAFTNMYTKAFDQKTFNIMKKIIPTESEVNDIVSATELNPPEILLIRFGKEKHLQTKIEVWSRIGGLEKRLEECQTKIKLVAGASKILKKSEPFKEALACVASFNEKIHLFNKETGFELTSLLMLKSLRSEKGENLLDMVLRSVGNV